MAGIVLGKYGWKGGRDSEGNREYKVTHLVETLYADGPSVALSAFGLPGPGDFWQYENDIDIWAYFRPDAEAVIHEEKRGESAKLWLVTSTFTTKNKGRCQDTEVENPIFEPQKVSGGFTKDKEEATVDRWGSAIINSAHEAVRGSQVEFDVSRPQVKIEQNVLDLELGLIVSMRDTTNLNPMWGLPAGTVKLSNFTFQRKYYGVCFPYYVRSFEFDIRFEGWEKYALDEATKALSGKWNLSTGEWDRIAVGSGVLNPTLAGVFDPTKPRNPNPANPNHFVRFRDKQGELAKTILDGQGMPWNPIQPPGMIVACDQCETVPETLYAYGVSFGLAGLAGAAVLAHTTGCEWATSGGGGDQVYLSYAEDTNQWVLNNTSNETFWKRSNRAWNCEGNNGMVRFGGNGPAYAYVSMGASNPGRIKVDKYGQSDFSLLGLPLYL